MAVFTPAFTPFLRACPWDVDGVQSLVLCARRNSHGVITLTKRLNTWESRGGSPPPPGTTGLFHVGILYPARAALADALGRLMKARIRLNGASDHGVSEALYLRDQDQNGLELYWDKPRESWPRTPDGKLAMFTRPLDLEALLRGADPS
jgi:catechol 2,3-dioxygenase